MKRQLRNKLILLAEKDQGMRTQGKWDVSVDKRNLQELKNLIKRYGWPKINDVGIEGSEAAWLIAQHADFDLQFQIDALRMIKEHAKKGEAPLHQIAYLTDRILANQNKKQVFGTQFYKTKRGYLKLRPIRNFKNIDKQRIKFNLPPLQLYIQKIKEMKKKSG
jgi:hypothetical protein